ncbi:GTP-binding protein [Campylobacter sp. MIT 12-5580]|uniref:YcjF family protein n=1 Tax=Campylobacter sp. MIT 12-5580 TaxID=2040651 RepID=UPI0010F53A50|nr:DUF697 domain-containing protein [Campylobacter sp. MIT 12-5580]TKX30279.1 GTP-binding protein [Campylobacter sp. MIT 12-5580]
MANIDQAHKEIDLTGAFEKVQKLLKDSGINAKLNVLIAGAAGVGKSTLINAIFGKETAQTGQGSAVTQETKEYIINENFSIFDTKGLEADDFQNTMAKIENFLAEKQKEKTDEQIHIAWLCISEPSRRTENGEKPLVRLLKKYNISTLIVITKAEQDKDEKGEKFSDKVKKIFAEYGTKEDEVIRVRAISIEDDDGHIKPVMGIDELLKKTYELLPKAQQQALIREQKADKELKKKEATKWVNYHSGIAGAIAANPIPFSDIALLLPQQLAMMYQLSRIYNIELSKENATQLITAFGATIATGFAARVVAGALKLIPGVGTIAGGAIGAGVASTTTKLMGQAYISYLDANFKEIAQGVFKPSEEGYKKYLDKKEIQAQIEKA